MAVGLLTVVNVDPNSPVICYLSGVHRSHAGQTYREFVSEMLNKWLRQTTAAGSGEERAF